MDNAPTDDKGRALVPNHLDDDWGGALKLTPTLPQALTFGTIAEAF